jgi:hypothetical protein
MSTGSVNNRELQPAVQPPQKERETARTFQGSRGIQPCKLWVAANWMAISGGGSRWSLRIDYDARSFSKLSWSCLFTQTAAWLAAIAPSSHQRSAIKIHPLGIRVSPCRPAHKTDIIWSIETPLICARCTQTRWSVDPSPASPGPDQELNGLTETDPEVKLNTVALFPGGSSHIRLIVEF